MNHRFLSLFSAAISFVICAVIFQTLHVYDWGQPFAKFICLGSFFALILYLFKHHDHNRSENKIVHTIEIIFAVLIITTTLYSVFSTYGPYLVQPPFVDIGYTTQGAASLLFLEGQNPYQSSTLSVVGDNPSYWGYKYGPFMIVGYAASAFLPQTGYKLMNYLYLALTIGLVAALGFDHRQKMLPNTATILYSLALFVIPQYLWFELFQQGANDIFPLMLLLASLLAIRWHYWWVAGLLLGLSFSAKFAPALFLMILLMRKSTPRTFFYGTLVGLAPFLPFLAWDAPALIQNNFIFHFTKAFDSTSLYSLLPKQLHYIFPVTQLLSIGYMFIMTFARRIDYREVTLHFTLLYLIIEATYTEVHRNHFIIFVPFIALLVSWYRYSFITKWASTAA